MANIEYATTKAVRGRASYIVVGSGCADAIKKATKKHKEDEPQKEEQVVETEPTSDTLEKLQTVMEECPSDWRENAKWRQDNRRWLRVSGLIANHILDYIDKSGMSADEVESDIEQKVGIGKDTFSDMLKGRHNYTLDDIAKLEEYLNIQIFDKITKL